MTSNLRRLVPALALSFVAFIGPPGEARACSDSGMPVIGPREPFDGGPGCTTVADGCGIYRVVCPPDSGSDLGPPMCGQFGDAGVESARYECETDRDCPAGRFALVCGDDGFCECDSPAPPSGGCSVAHAADPRAAWGLAALALVVTMARRRAIART